MVDETRTFGAATLLTVVGLAVLLWGVSLNNGTEFNAPMLAGGAVIAVGIGVIMVAVMRLEEGHEAA